MATMRSAVTCLGLMALGLLAAVPAGAATRDRLTFMLNFVPYGIHTAFYTFSTFEPNLKALAAAKGMEIVPLYLSDWGGGPLRPRPAHL